MEASSNIKKGFLIATVILLLVPALLILKGYWDGAFSSVIAFERYIGQMGWWGPIMLTLFQAFQVVIPILPGMLGCAVGGVVYGPVGGFICNFIGISAGSIAAFWLARKYGVKLVKSIIKEEKYEKYAGWISNKKSYSLVLWLMILLPFAPDDFFCYFSGLTKMSKKKFTWIIITAKPWCILLYSILFGAFSLNGGGAYDWIFNYAR
ncbi:TVP38/TMEM64 family protein [Paenibacillus sp. GCM10027629]|uniref:TVP38/TMEM64 family protein n=1 Tax=Paenibacillus sp. GCM10027629 TaxID=3273414 RepID=UPI00363BC817